MNVGKLLNRVNFLVCDCLLLSFVIKQACYFERVLTIGIKADSVRDSLAHTRRSSICSRIRSFQVMVNKTTMTTKFDGEV